MKYFAFFLLLNLFVCLAYSQKTCEEMFEQNQPCTPCQQTLHKYNVKVDLKNPSEDKCLFAPSLLFHLSEIQGTITNTTSVDDKKKIVGEVIDKTCEDTKECTESYAVTAYKEIDSACSAEIIQDSSFVNEAYTAIISFYTAIPLKAFLCNKEGDGML
jgi:hypothetical protein